MAIVKSKPIDLDHDPITGKPMEPFIYYVTSKDTWGKMLKDIGITALQYYPSELQVIEDKTQ